MKKPKHGWNTREHYFSIHEKILRQYESRMVSPRKYSIRPETDQWVRLVAEGILFNTSKGNVVRVDIRKDVEIDDSLPHRPMARTFDYTYSANYPKGSALIRYCSPHYDIDNPNAPDHHKFHHKHDFRAGIERITRIDDDGWPHVGEFLNEVLAEL